MKHDEGAVSKTTSAGAIRRLVRKSNLSPRVTVMLGPVVLDLKAPPSIRDSSLGKRRDDMVRHDTIRTLVKFFFSYLGMWGS